MKITEYWGGIYKVKGIIGMRCLKKYGLKYYIMQGPRSRGAGAGSKPLNIFEKEKTL